jgi:hypothetical protein
MENLFPKYEKFPGFIDNSSKKPLTYLLYLPPPIFSVVGVG